MAIWPKGADRIRRIVAARLKRLVCSTGDLVSPRWNRRMTATICRQISRFSARLKAPPIRPRMCAVNRATAGCRFRNVSPVDASPSHQLAATTSPTRPSMNVPCQYLQATNLAVALVLLGLTGQAIGRAKSCNTIAIFARSLPRIVSPATGRTVPRGRPTCGSISARWRWMRRPSCPASRTKAK